MKKKKMFQLQKISSGNYQSKDGRISIVRKISQQTYRADEISWELKIDGAVCGFDFDKKIDAVEKAERLISKDIIIKDDISICLSKDSIKE
mgnify:CR=1 FL=1